MCERRLCLFLFNVLVTEMPVCLRSSVRLYASVHVALRRSVCASPRIT